MRRLVQVGSLVAVWAALWSDLSAATLLSGVLVGTVVLALAPPSSFGHLRIDPLGPLMFTAKALWRLIQSNATVAWEALLPGSGIQEAIVAVPVADASEDVVTAIAAFISLSPGTVAVRIRSGVVFVHVLHASDIDAVRRDLDRHVAAVKQLMPESGDAS